MKRVLVLSLLVSRLCMADVFFAETFEGPLNPGWTGWGYVEVVDDNVHSGTKAAMATYNNIEDACYLTINPSRNDYYVRYYIYYALGMRYWSCKVMRAGYWDDQKSYYVNVGWNTDGVNETGMDFSIRGTSGIDKDFHFNWDHPQNSCSGRWLCLEFHIKLNTPGQSDGMLEAWIDGVPAFSQGSLNIRGTIAENPHYHWIFGNYSNGVQGTPIPGAPWYVWIDDVVYSPEKVGPLGWSQTPMLSASVTPTPLTAAPTATQSAVVPTASPTPTPMQPPPRRQIKRYPINDPGWAWFYVIGFNQYFYPRGWRLDGRPQVIGTEMVFWMVQTPASLGEE